MAKARAVAPLKSREELKKHWEHFFQNGGIIPHKTPDRFEPVVRAKMERYPARILGVTVCDDDLEGIVSAAKAYLDNGADFLIFTE